MLGRRASYLNPIRMYVFTSAFFFLIFFSIIKPGDTIRESPPLTATEWREGLQKSQAKLERQLKTEEDSSDRVELRAQIDTVKADLERLAKDSLHLDSLTAVKKFNNRSFHNVGGLKTKEAYKQAQEKMPEHKRDNWVERRIHYRLFDMGEKYNNNAKEIFAKVGEGFLHRFPQMFFISLPFFALFLRILYLRRKSFFYVNHAIFAIYFYCATFLILLAIFGLNKLIAYTHWQWLYYVIGILVFSIFFYLYKALRNFYDQRRAKTFLKYVLLTFTTIFFFVALMIFFLAFSLYQV
jgi:Protein of unknown function (DUF3667)